MLAEPRLGRVSGGHRAPQHRKQQTAQYRVGRIRGLTGRKYAVVAALREHLRSGAATEVSLACRISPRRPAAPSAPSSPAHVPINDAKPVLAEALATFRRLGARSGTKRAESELRACGVAFAGGLGEPRCAG